MYEIPFRWDITQRNCLGSLVEGEGAAAYDGFPSHLLFVCSRILAFSGNSALVFVGRSPESIFDHLRGLLFETSWFDRLELLHFSMRFREESEIRQNHPGAIEAMRAYLQHLGLHPEGIAVANRPLTFIDLVSTGDTFGRLITFFHNWSDELACDWNGVSRRIRLVGIIEKTKARPKAWRWQQHAAWVSLLGSGLIKNISVPRELWEYLGNYQNKVSPSYTPSLWGTPELASPTYAKEQLKALRLAYELFELGRTKERRDEFASLLVREQAMEHEWFRTLVQEIRS
jgi:hypothetical protein